MAETEEGPKLLRFESGPHRKETPAEDSRNNGWLDRDARPD